MWCSIQRRTASGKRLGEHESLTIEQALYAVTLGAAYTLHMDDKVGSLEVGKYADMVVLGEDLYKINPDKLVELPVKATIVGGDIYGSYRAS